MMREATPMAISRMEKLETMLFAFIWNRATYPMGCALGKSDEEIADKTLELMEAAKEMVDIPLMFERLSGARARRHDGVNTEGSVEGGCGNGK